MSPRPHSDLIRLAAWAIPLLVAYFAVIGRLPATEQPVWLTAITALLLVVCLWHALVTHHLGRRRLGSRYIAFFLAWISLLALADYTDLLAGRREPLTGFERQVPRNVLGLGHWGDWRYRVVPPAPTPVDLIVVMVPTPESRADSRWLLAGIVRQAISNGAKGIALDFFFEQSSPMDPFLASEIQAAQKAKLPVVLGVRRAADRSLGPAEPPLAPTLAEVASHIAHLHGYLESDGRVRLIPTFLPGRHERALSVEVAELLRAERLRLPSNRLIRFLAPEQDVPTLRVNPGRDTDWQQLKNRFVLVGSGADADGQATAYDPNLSSRRAGVLIHAWAAHSLATGHFLIDIDPRLTFPWVFLLCYLLAVVHARTTSARNQMIAALSTSVVATLAAVIAARLGLWLDLSYPLIGIWGLTAIQLLRTTAPVAGAERRESRATRVQEDPMDRPLIDVFVSHNSSDKPAARALCKALESRGIRPWLDEQQLVPGQPWQEALEDAVETASAVAVLVGADGLGPWEVMEMRAALTESVRKGLPVIPVLLPDAPRATPKLPLFLAQYTWVDLRGGFTEDGLDRLQWGITGRRPGQR